MVRFLVARREATEDQDVLVRDLIEAAALQAYPVCVLFDPQVEGLPVLAPLNIVLLDQVGTLAAVEASHHVKSLVVERDRRVEVSSCVQTGDLGPSVATDVIHFALVHGLARQRGANSVDPRPGAASEDRSQSVSPSLEDHVSPLLQPLVDELIAGLRGLARLTTSGQEDSTLFILHGHEVGRYLYVHDVGAIRMRAEVVHEQVVRIVDKEVKSVNHLAVVANQGHLYRLFHNLGYGLLGSLLLLKQLDLHLLF